MPRRPTTLQLDLFSCPRDAEITQPPRWHTSPSQTRQTLTSLIVRLMLDQTDNPVVEPQEAHDDL